MSSEAHWRPLHEVLDEPCRTCNAQCMTFTNDLLQRWGQIIRKTRRDQGLSLEALAGRAGVDTGHLSKAERGLAGFGDEARIRLATALGRSVHDLFPYPDTANQETECPSVASAADGASSPTPATAAVTRSPAPSARAQAGSDHEESPGNE